MKLGKQYQFYENDNDKKILYNYLCNNLGEQTVQEEITYGKKHYQIQSVPFFIIESLSSDSSSISIVNNNNAANSNNSKKKEERKSYQLAGARKSNAFLQIFHKF